MTRSLTHGKKHLQTKSKSRWDGFYQTEVKSKPIRFLAFFFLEGSFKANARSVWTTRTSSSISLLRHTMSSFAATHFTMPVFSSNFDSGNGTLINLEKNPDLNVVVTAIVEICGDIPSELEKKTFKQWFHFRLVNVKGATINVNIQNAGKTSFPNAWVGYNVCASYDRNNWFRIPTACDKASGHMTWS